MINSKYGTCSCGGELKPIFFEEEETKIVNGTMIKTGRTRMAVSHLVCDECLRNKCVDDSFDGPWHNN